MSEQFLAEASVLVSPDLTRFREKLLGELLVATRNIPPVAVPVTTTSNVAGATKAAEQAVKKTTDALNVNRAAEQTAGAEKIRSQVATAKLTAAETAYASALTRTAGLQKAGITATTETARARAQYQAAISANIAADRAWRAAIIAGDRAQLQSAAKLFARTAGIEKQASASLKAALAEDVRTAAIRQGETVEARAAKTSAARTSFLSRGAAAQGLAFAGLRGAVLASNAAFLGGTVAAIAFGKAVLSAAQLESELNVFRVTAQATRTEMERVSAAAFELGADVSLPSVSAGDAAQAMTELAKAGLSVKDSMDGARGVLQLAAAAQLDNAAATNIAASALNAFGLAGDQAAHVADVLANASNEAQGGIDEIGIALQQSAAVARQAGLSLEQTATVLTILARNGLRGSDAGTSFRTALIRLINPTEKAAGVIKDLNLQLRDSAGNIRLDVFQQFIAATEDMTRAQRDQALAVIFGQDAIRAAAILSREGAKGFLEVAKSLEREGAAAELAGARAAGLAGEASALGSNLETLGTTLAQVVNPGLEEFAHILNEGIGGANQAVAAVKAFKEGLGREEVDLQTASLDELLGAIARFRGATRSQLGENSRKEFDAINQAILRVSKTLQAGTAGDVANFFDTFRRSSPQIEAAMMDDVITPLERAQLEATALGRAFTAAIDQFDASDSIANAIRDMIAGAKAAAAEAGTTIGASLTSAMFQAVRDAKGRTAGIEEEILDIEIRGGSNQEIIAKLKDQRQEQQKIIDAVGERGGVTTKERRDAKAKVKSINEEVARLEDEIQAERDKGVQAAEQRARDAQTARDKADQAFLDSLQPRRDRIDRQTQRAAGTPGLQDNVNAARTLKQRLLREIEIIRASNIDAKAKAEEIRKRADELITVRQTITKARDDLREAREKIAEDRAAERTSLLEARLGLAEARGDKGAQVRAIDILIADVRRRISRTKKATAAYVELQTEKQNLLNKRKEVLEQDKELAGGSGTTASDLLKQFVDIFQKSGGNLINADQPFAGPSGFSLPLDALLKFRPASATAPVAGRAGRQLELRDGPLIQALDRLRIAYEQSSGNTSTAGVRGPFGAGVTAVQGLRDRQFWQSDETRKVIDS